MDRVNCLVVSFVIFLFLMSTGCFSLLHSPVPEAGGTYKYATPFSFNGLARTYLLHVPESYCAKKTYPLLIVLHGGFNTAHAMEEETGFSDLADDKGFFVVYPNGMGIWGYIQHWNAGHCCGKAAAEDINDVAVLDYIIRNICTQYSIDTNRVYMVGHSNGGMLAYLYAEERSDELAGLAVVSGAINSLEDGGEVWNPTIPATSLPTVIIHGKDDHVIPFAGGVPPERKGRTYTSVEDAVQLWLRWNQCDPSSEEIININDYVTQRCWHHCESFDGVNLYALKGWRHNWPGPYFTKELPEDHPLREFDAAEVIWEFFEGHHIPSASIR